MIEMVFPKRQRAGEAESAFFQKEGFSHVQLLSSATKERLLILMSRINRCVPCLLLL